MSFEIWVRVIKTEYSVMKTETPLNQIAHKLVGSISKNNLSESCLCIFILILLLFQYLKIENDFYFDLYCQLTNRKLLHVSYTLICMVNVEVTNKIF